MGRPVDAGPAGVPGPQPSRRAGARHRHDPDRRGRPAAHSCAYLAELERGERVDRMDLSRLGRDDMARLLADELGHVPDAGLVDRTLERTGGNPFYAEQVLAASRETGDGAVPARLRDVVLARIAAVSNAGQEVLRVASAAGARIDDELLVAVSDLPRRWCGRRSARSSIGGSSCPPGPDDPHFAFRHALLQEVIHGELLPGERARLHAGTRRHSSAGGGSRRRPSDAGPAPTAAELAYHWDAAGDDASRTARDRRCRAVAERATRTSMRIGATCAHSSCGTASRRRDGAAGRSDRHPRPCRGDRRPGRGVPGGGRSRPAGHRRGRSGQPTRGGRPGSTSDSAGTSGRRATGLRRRPPSRKRPAHPGEPPSAARARILAHHAGILMLERPLRRLDADRRGGPRRRAGGRLAVGPGAGARGPRQGPGAPRAGRRRRRAFPRGSRDRRGARRRRGDRARATNLAILLDRVGRTAEALDVAAAGWERAREIGVERTYGGLLLAVAAKAAIALGRWDEAETFLALGLAHDPIGTPGIRLRIQRGRLDTMRGDLVRAADVLAAATRSRRGRRWDRGPGRHPRGARRAGRRRGRDVACQGGCRGGAADGQRTGRPIPRWRSWPRPGSGSKRTPPTGRAPRVTRPGSPKPGAAPPRSRPTSSGSRPSWASRRGGATGIGGRRHGMSR